MTMTPTAHSSRGSARLVAARVADVYVRDRRCDAATDAGMLNTSKYWIIISAAYLFISNVAFPMLPVTINCGWMEFIDI
ncbi:hypothetical protein PR003_g16745 [Phytophthora rubi]|uniref:Uncharacterized protein n=1 Tax=Phytophthora rubi TaxID=129364 RepID=A0A6A3KR99_9STRA|nr:hypothetical protein PR002_g19522 [Phytophthora rubi]KAE9007918.1 hypothetical protein PR001_g16845 [Phytophthora rubi]KAE9324405.1 hypothetical protein PR003_g16745 [Phytophthora rubi]